VNLLYQRVFLSIWILPAVIIEIMPLLAEQSSNVSTVEYSLEDLGK
jgi:hypothetical protein